MVMHAICEAVWDVDESWGWGGTEKSLCMRIIYTVIITLVVELTGCHCFGSENM